MNFNFGGSSHQTSSSDSPFDNLMQSLSIFEDLDLEETILQEMLDDNDNDPAENRLQRENQSRHGGSVPGHKVVNRDHVAANKNLFNDYFSDNPLYKEATFRRRYRMSSSLFMRIVDAVRTHDTYFEQKIDAAHREGPSTLQKITAAFRMLAYGTPSDSQDDYLKIGESTAIECFKRFCRAIVEIFSEEYLRTPNENDVARLLYVAEMRGFPGMLGSLDCMHWKWNNCPKASSGQFSGRCGSPTIILEAIADYDLWIWHAYFGLPGTNNDINVLESSHLFSNLAQGLAPEAHYVIGGQPYSRGYYLADGIYPKWSTLVQTIHKPTIAKHRYFAKMQEACRKDVERAFGVLQQRFHILARSCRFWEKNVLHDIMTACIIMHNMIIEDERDLSTPITRPSTTTSSTLPPDIEVELVTDENIRFQQFLVRHRQIRDSAAHYALRNALIDHLWATTGNMEH